MGESDAKISRRARAVKAFFLLVHFGSRTLVSVAFGLCFGIAKGWTFAFVLVAWSFHVINGIMSDLARREQRERQIQEHISGRIHVAPGVEISEDQARRIFEIFQEGKTQSAGLN